MNVILNNYNIGEIISVETLKSNVIIVITKDKKYILKEKKDLKSCEHENKILLTINKNELIVSNPILTNDKKYYVLYNENVYSLYTYIEGKSIESHYDNDEIEDILYQYGSSIARLHNVLKLCEDIALFNESDVYKNVIDWAIPLVKEKFNLSDNIIEYINSYEDIYNKLPKQLIHRDIHQNNILLRNNKVIGFIDFEISVKAIRLFDICYCLTAILSEDFNKRDEWLKYIKPLVSGYQSINPLTKEEKNCIILCFMIIELIFTGYFISEDNEKLLLLNYNMLNWIFENKNNIKI